MKRKELIKKSIYIISEYYKGNLQPFFNALDGDALWLGPRAGQRLRGRENIIKAWQTESTRLVFSMGTIKTETVALGRSGLEVILTYNIYTHFPTGEIDKHHQRLHYSWSVKKVGQFLTPVVTLINISNLSEKETEGMRIYASSTTDSRVDALNTRIARIYFRVSDGRGPNATTYYLNSSTILWIESIDEGRHSLIHCLDGDYKSMERLRYFEDRFSDMLIRIHISYLINPLYIQSIQRFTITLSDGTLLTVPEKKYTAVKKSILEWNHEHKKE